MGENNQIPNVTPTRINELNQKISDVSGKDLVENRDGILNLLLHLQNGRNKVLNATSDLSSKAPDDIKLNQIQIDAENINKSDASDIQKHAALNNLLNAGRYINVPLYHSGFVVKMKPLTLSQCVALDEELLENEMVSCINTVGLIYMNINLIYDKIVWKYINDNIIGTNVKDLKLNDLSRFIDWRDIHLLMLALIQTRYVNGYVIQTTCSQVNKDYKPMTCNGTVDKLIDLNTLVVINQDLISKKMRKTLASTELNSISTSDIIEYKKELLMSLSDIIVAKSQGLKVSVAITTKSVDDLLYKNSKTLARTEEKIHQALRLTKEEESIQERIVEINPERENLSDAEFEELNRLTDELTKIKAEKIESLFSNDISLVYSFLIKSIKIEGSTTYTAETESDVLKTLKVLTERPDLMSSLLNDVALFTKTKRVFDLAILGDPCPRCKEIISDGDGVLKDHVLINMYTHFLDECRRISSPTLQ